MNYAETMTHWYLRLNGFFLISRFVLHDYDEVRRVNADCDLLALRPPHVYERIGGRPGDWDYRLFEAIGAELGRDMVAVIVEAKGGIEAGPGHAFDVARLTYAIARLGLFAVDSVSEIARELVRAPLYRGGNVTVVKMVAAHALLGEVRLGEQYLELPLSHVDRFLRTRLQNYRENKTSARVFFPSDLLQYLIWRTEVEPDQGVG